MPFVRPSYAATTLRVSNFGGFFEKSFAKGVYPEFTKQTGIEVQSIPQSASSQFLVQIGQAVQAGAAPMDVCCVGQSDAIRGRQRGLWGAVDKAKLTNLTNLMPGFVNEVDGEIDGVGAMAWYMTLIANPAELEPLPNSWTELWKSRPSAWAVQGNGTNVLLDITASVFFGGPAILDTNEGIDKVIAKIAELKPNVKLWWTDEGSVQSAFQNDEIVGGTFFHDVTMTMKNEGTDVASIFPKEGAVLGYNVWCVPKVSQVTDATVAFLNWSATPDCHALIAKHAHAAPLIERSKLSLTDDEFNSVSSQGKPIVVAYDAKVKNGEYMSTQMLKMLGK
jgi:putative spermidine/putrescine transport system substrate-binding protein